MIYLHAQFLALPSSTVAVVVIGCGIGYPMQVLWFSKIVAGLRKALHGKAAADPKASGVDAKAQEASAHSMRAEAFPVGLSATDDGSHSKEPNITYAGEQKKKE